MNKINQDNIITNDNDKEKGNLKKMISNCSKLLNSKENNNDFIKIINELKGMKETEDKEKNELFSKVHVSKDDKEKKKKRIKKKCDYAGLRNVGSYCYLNSVIQQLFHISQFKFSIMNSNDKKEPIKSDYLDDDNILHQLQKLFVYLSFTSYGEVIPDDLVKSIKDFGGTPIGPNMDSLELYSNLCDKIEESLKGNKNE
jgi:ubiquitin C-terminal hydrolase